MKKTLLILSVGVVLSSCQQSVEPQEQVEFIETSNLSEVSQMFVPLGQSAWSIVGNSESRELVYKEIEKQFDGDFNVLFTTLINNSNNGRLIKTELNVNINNTLSEFKSHEETKYL